MIMQTIVIVIVIVKVSVNINITVIVIVDPAAAPEVCGAVEGLAIAPLRRSNNNNDSFIII